MGYIHHIFFIQSFTDGHLCWQSFDQPGPLASWFLSFGYIQKWTAGSYGRSFSFLNYFSFIYKYLSYILMEFIVIFYTHTPINLTYLSQPTFIPVSTDHHSSCRWTFLSFHRWERVCNSCLSMLGLVIQCNILRFYPFCTNGKISSFLMAD
jgi:hypothetical protein